MSSTLEKQRRRTARHDGGIKAPGSNGIKTKLRDLSISPPTLLEVWLAIRGVSVPRLAASAGIADNTIYNLLDGPDRARVSTLGAIAEAVPSRITAAQVRALASRRVRNPDRVSEEIAEALAQADSSPRP